MPMPRAMNIPVPVLEQPSIKPFKWEPIPVYVEDIPEDPEEAKTTTKEEEPKSEELPADVDLEEVVPEIGEIQMVQIPLTEIEVPLPRPEILATAATTAGISSVVAVSGTLLATTLFRELQPILKPVFKFIVKKVASMRGQKPPLTYGRERQLARHQRKLGKKAIQVPK